MLREVTVLLLPFIQVLPNLSVAWYKPDGEKKNKTKKQGLLKCSCKYVAVDILPYNGQNLTEYANPGHLAFSVHTEERLYFEDREYTEKMQYLTTVVSFDATVFQSTTYCCPMLLSLCFWIYCRKPSGERGTCEKVTWMTLHASSSCMRKMEGVA